MKNIIIAGLGSAGFAAMAGIRKVSRDAVITVIDPKEHDLLHPCGLPYAIEGKADRAGLCQDIQLERSGVTRVRGHLSVVCHDSKMVEVKLFDGTKAEYHYDSLIICTGASPVIPPVPGSTRLRGRGLHTLASRPDLEAVLASAEGASSAFVIGAGAIGLETAVALKARLERVTVFEMKESPLPGVLDPDMSEAVLERIKESGIEFQGGTAVEEVLGDESFTGIRAGGTIFEADFAVMAAGFRPDVSFAAVSGIETDKAGIRVNSRLETNLKDVYAAGDCVSGWSVIDGTPSPAKLATSAYKQGLSAGANAAGGNEEYRGTAGTFVTEIGGLEAAGTGFTLAAAKAAGYSAAAGKIKTHTLPHYMKGSSEITVKLIADTSTGRVLGAQAVGREGAASRINIVSAAIEFGLTVSELRRVEMAYCPALSEVDDALMKAADFCLRRMK